MKNIVGMLLLCILFTGCTIIRADYGRVCIVINVYKTADGNCTYGIKEDNGMDSPQFYAPCGKFNVGDTITVVKK